MRKFLYAKIHHARVTELNRDYEGLITIPWALAQRCGIEQYEHVLVADCETGVRFETYAILGPSDSVCINGAAALLDVGIGDRLIIMAFEYSDRPPSRELIKSRIIVCDENNRVIEQI